jgi:hypothetical protein
MKWTILVMALCAWLVAGCDDKKDDKGTKTDKPAATTATSKPATSAKTADSAGGW